LRFLLISTPSNAGDFLDYLTLPALVDIQLEQYSTQGNKWVDQFISLLYRSSCRVERLHLACSRRISDDRLIQCLQSIPSLLTLELGGYKASSLGKRAMNQLAHRVVVPNLQTIKLQYDNDSTFDIEAFVDLIASRWHVDAAAVDDRVARLKNAQVSIFHNSVDVNSEPLRRLRAFREEGLDVCLRDERLNISLLSNFEA